MSRPRPMAPRSSNSASTRPASSSTAGRTASSRSGRRSCSKVFHEYALEPAVLGTWQTVRYFLDAFGPWRGRFLAEYPGRWKRMVYEGLACPDVEKHKVIERLQRLDKRVFSPRRGAAYDPAQP